MGKFKQLMIQKDDLSMNNTNKATLVTTESFNFFDIDNELRSMINSRRKWSSNREKAFMVSHVNKFIEFMKSQQ